MDHIHSPLRYPGGKGTMASCLADIILFNNVEMGAYYEPYAGGAGAALYLLYHGFVERLYLNDADYTIYAFWKSVLNNTDLLLNRIHDVELSVEEWLRQKLILKSPKGYSTFEVGFAAFFLNRCSRSGILSNSGPIGGYNQRGKWTIDVRFNKMNLIKRIKRIADYRKVISVTNQDALDFLKQKLPKGRNRNNIFVYLDPPYFKNGRTLYVNYYEESDHLMLSRYMKSQKILPWVMTYDNVQYIRDLYRDNRIYEFSLTYSVQEKKKGSEILIVPDSVRLPGSLNIAGNKLNQLRSCN